jgi:glycerophosphoryl diester phosphodiesterase
MIRIAHRGNYKGKDALRENTISYIEEAIAAGYDVEIDVWLLDGKWYLGHDFPGEIIELPFMERPQIWTHAKDLQGYVSLHGQKNVHVFWHDKDEFTFTSKGIKWCKGGVITHDGVMVMPEYFPFALTAIRSFEVIPLGICSDDFGLFE